MFFKVFLPLILAVGVSSLKCAFDVSAAFSQLDVEGGVDKCQSSDNYCVKITNVNGIYAKGCSLTADKITGNGMPAHINCAAEGCNSDGSLCCCQGDMCNSSSKMTILVPLFTIGVAKMLV